MSSLDLKFDQVIGCQASVHQWDGLVAVFSLDGGRSHTQVYCQNPPLSQPGLEIIPLRKFLEKDLSQFDTPWIGFTALDVLREDLLTKGTGFYAIQTLFEQAGQHAALKTTAFQLARHLIDDFSLRKVTLDVRARQRAEARLLLLLLPVILGNDIPVQNLIAVTPPSRLEDFLEPDQYKPYYLSSASPHLLPLMESVQSSTSASWIICLEELEFFYPQFPWQSKLRIELREVLNRAKCLEAWRPVLLELAKTALAFDLRPIARKLAAEHLAASNESEDLVAILPHHSIDQFLFHEKAILVYRTSSSRYGSSPYSLHRHDALDAGPASISMEELLQVGPPPDYGACLISFQSLRLMLAEKNPAEFVEFSGILWKAGCWQALIRSFWLTARDLYRIRPEPTPNLLLELFHQTARASTMIGLLTPWQWRQGRWGVFLVGVYQTLSGILDMLKGQSEPPLDLFYDVLAQWYGPPIFLDEHADPKDGWEKLRKLTARLQDMPVEPIEIWRPSILALQDIYRFVLGFFSAADEESPVDDSQPRTEIQTMINVSEMIRRTACESIPPSCPSPLFVEAWGILLTIHRQREKIMAREHNMDRKIQQLRHLEEETRRRTRALFVAAHELDLLTTAYQVETQRITQALESLANTARLEFQLKNRWVDLYEDVNLTIKLSNEGQAEARNLELALVPSTGLRLLDGALRREIQSMASHTGGEVNFKICPIRMDAELRLECTFLDVAGKAHYETWINRLNVRDIDEAPFVSKANHYQFGSPIQNPAGFYGRRTELQDIISHLVDRSDQKFLLSGPRRMGKTSFLYMLLALLDPSTSTDSEVKKLSRREVRRMFELDKKWDEKLDHVHPIFLSSHSFNLQDNEIDSDQFFYLLIDKACAGLHAPQVYKEELLSEFYRRSPLIGTTNAALEQAQKLLNAYPTERLVILLDEYDEVLSTHAPRLDRNLREFVSAEQRIAWVMASTQALQIHSRSIDSPWFNLFYLCELKCLSDDAAHLLVEKPNQGEGIIWRSDAIQTLLDQTGRHPAFTQLFCAAVVAYLNQVHSNTVLPDTIDNVAHRIISERQSETNPYFQYFWDEPNGVGQLILLILDEYQPLSRMEIRQRVTTYLAEKFGERPLRQVRDMSINQSGNEIAWQDLHMKQGFQIIEQVINAISVDSMKRYRFTVPFFRQWLHHSIGLSNLHETVYERIRREMENDGYTL